MSDRGIVYKPDADDPKRVKLSRGLPAGISRAEITFRVEGGLRGTRVVRRSEAAFAHLRTGTDRMYEGEWSEAEWLTPDSAMRYIHQAQRRIDHEDNEIRRRRESVDLSCPWCARQRTYIGVLGFVTAETGWLTDHPSEWGQQVVKQHAYRCDRCGSMMFFADGFLAHPLPGRPATGEPDRPPPS
ncbi:hypothetical protein [Nocardia sp. BMG51109]|uniref:hypothetical protein n=1 Tax=Nocardia sp. BMG51109 TaxID=1056816 RepID=UPI000463E033|nr:hypothetical protein [Nocardia sp. BMG51109]